MAAALKIAEADEQPWLTSKDDSGIELEPPEKKPAPAPHSRKIEAYADVIFDALKGYVERRLERAHERFLKHHHPQHPLSEEGIAELRHSVDALRRELDEERHARRMLQAELREAIAYARRPQ